tara:strand:+ start:256 stop:438 length:183 start_codon:yes stop_codon:yes gene_type:complete
MKKRLLSNYLTTLLGLALVVYCAFMMHKGSSVTDMAGFFGMAGLLLRSKDSLIGLPKEEK